MNRDSLSIVFAGGGTLGHLFAGLAVADAMRELSSHARLASATCWLGQASRLCQWTAGQPGRLSYESWASVAQNARFGPRPSDAPAAAHRGIDVALPTNVGSSLSGRVSAPATAVSPLRADGDLARALAIHFAGSGSGSERKHVEDAGYTYHKIVCRPLPRRPWAAGGFLVNNLRGYFAGRRLLRHLRADAVVGLGGYASAPVARAAVSLAIPLVLVEQNAIPGRVNRWLSRHAASVCTAFDSPAIQRLGPVYLTGTPVRRGFLTPSIAARSEKLLIITGGSQGAAVLNAAMPEALGKCKRLIDGWRIVHQAGHREVEVTGQRYQRVGITAEVTAFANLASLLPQASLAVCRAGGSTIAELCVTGTPAILCPYPHASHDHQRHNAAAVPDGCRTIDERLPDFVDRLAAELSILLTNTELRTQMSRALLRQSHPTAAREIARTVLATITNSAVSTA